MSRCSDFFLVAALLIFATPVFAQVSIPEIPFDSVPNLLKLPEHMYLGEAVGVATNSKGHIYVYTRTGSESVTVGTARPFARGFARLFEFDQNGNFVRELGQGLYAFTFAHTVRVDPQDNIWAVDEGSDMVIEFNPEGQVIMTLGRKPESVIVPAPPPEAPEASTPAGSVPAPLAASFDSPFYVNFNRETDIAWDPAGNSFVSDGYGNSRVAKFDKHGKFLKSWGSKGTGPGQFRDVHTIAADAKGNVYVGDRANRRIQVFDNDGGLKATYINVGAPWAICITPGPHQYLYSSNSTGTEDTDNGEIYKMELDGQIVGKFGHGGKQLKEFMAVHEIDCRTENEIYVGEISNWRVQKLILHPNQAK
jgi:DNA-binding beta-propeller fold protein YncE